MDGFVAINFAPRQRIYNFGVRLLLGDNPGFGTFRAKPNGDNSAQSPSSTAFVSLASLTIKFSAALEEQPRIVAAWGLDVGLDGGAVVYH